MSDYINWEESNSHTVALGGLMVSVLAIGPKVCTFKLGLRVMDL
jgi:hypothetical protein